MLNVSMNLIDDLHSVIFNEISILKSEGFIFSDYDEWKSIELQNISKRISDLKQNGQDTAIEEENKNEDKLKKKFEKELIYNYYSIKQKLIPKMPRKIKHSSTFSCPDSFKKGLNNLENKILIGDLLFPHLSRSIFNTKEQDGMLFDFGVYHLHLGIEPDIKNKRFVQGANEILYCMFDNEYCYFIMIAEHGKWADKEILRIVKNNFPNLIENWRLKGVLEISQTFDEKDRLSLRKHSVNAVIDIDGDYYFSPGGGINGAGGPAASSINMTMQYHFYKYIEENMIKIISLNEEQIKSEIKLENNMLNLKCIDIPNLIFYDNVNKIKCFILLSEKRDKIERIQFTNI